MSSPGEVPSAASWLGILGIALGVGLVGLAHPFRQAAVVLAQFGQHVLWRHIRRVVVGDALIAQNFADGMQRELTYFARPLRQHLR